MNARECNNENKYEFHIWLLCYEKQISKTMLVRAAVAILLCVCVNGAFVSRNVPGMNELPSGMTEEHGWCDAVFDSSTRVDKCLDGFFFDEDGILPFVSDGVWSNLNPRGPPETAFWLIEKGSNDVHPPFSVLPDDVCEEKTYFQHYRYLIPPGVSVPMKSAQEVYLDCKKVNTLHKSRLVCPPQRGDRCKFRVANHVSSKERWGVDFSADWLGGRSNLACEFYCEMLPGNTVSSLDFSGTRVKFSSKDAQLQSEGPVYMVPPLRYTDEGYYDTEHCSVASYDQCMAREVMSLAQASTVRGAVSLRGLWRNSELSYSHLTRYGVPLNMFLLLSGGNVKGLSDRYDRGDVLYCADFYDAGVGICGHGVCRDVLGSGFYCACDGVWGPSDVGSGLSVKVVRYVLRQIHCGVQWPVSGIDALGVYLEKWRYFHRCQYLNLEGFPNNDIRVVDTLSRYEIDEGALESLSCKPGYFGPTCSPCPCSSHGVCVEVNLDVPYKCVCDQGWTGPLCGERQCLRDELGYECSGRGACVGGYMGYYDTSFSIWFSSGLCMSASSSGVIVNQSFSESCLGWRMLGSMLQSVEDGRVLGNSNPGTNCEDVELRLVDVKSASEVFIFKWTVGSVVDGKMSFEMIKSNPLPCSVRKNGLYHLSPLGPGLIKRDADVGLSVVSSSSRAFVGSGVPMVSGVFDLRLKHGLLSSARVYYVREGVFRVVSSGKYWDVRDCGFSGSENASVSLSIGTSNDVYIDNENGENWNVYALSSECDLLVQHVSRASSCECFEGSFGFDCGMTHCPVSKSSGKVCGGVGQGMCVEENGVHQCACEYGWGGEACDLKTWCPTWGASNVVCNGHGTCGIDGVCVCDEGWSGGACEFSASVFCGDCSGHGKCKGGVSVSPYCECFGGWGGPFCSERQCGHCDAAGMKSCESGSCVCKSGWVGVDCGVGCGCHRYSECVPFGVGGYRCVCPPGRGGSNCTELSCSECNELGTVSCGSSCVCSEGYSGELCEETSCDKGGGVVDELGKCDCGAHGVWEEGGCARVCPLGCHCESASGELWSSDAARVCPSLYAKFPSGVGCGVFSGRVSGFGLGVNMSFPFYLRSSLGCLSRGVGNELSAASGCVAHDLVLGGEECVSFVLSGQTVYAYNANSGLRLRPSGHLNQLRLYECSDSYTRGDWNVSGGALVYWGRSFSASGRRLYLSSEGGDVARVVSNVRREGGVIRSQSVLGLASGGFEVWVPGGCLTESGGVYPMALYEESVVLGDMYGRLMLSSHTSAGVCVGESCMVRVFNESGVDVGVGGGLVSLRMGFDGGWRCVDVRGVDVVVRDDDVCPLWSLSKKGSLYRVSMLGVGWLDYGGGYASLFVHNDSRVEGTYRWRFEGGSLFEVDSDVPVSFEWSLRTPKEAGSRVLEVVSSNCSYVSCDHGTFLPNGSCLCDWGWVGARCSSRAPLPPALVCENGGVVGLGGGCECLPAYGGDRCELSMCGSNGYAHLGECVCLSNWTGVWCDLPLCGLGSYWSVSNVSVPFGGSYVLSRSGVCLYECRDWYLDGVSRVLSSAGFPSVFNVTSFWVSGMRLFPLTVGGVVGECVSDEVPLVPLPPVVPVACLNGVLYADGSCECFVGWGGLNCSEKAVVPVVPSGVCGDRCHNTTVSLPVSSACEGCDVPLLLTVVCVLVVVVCVSFVYICILYRMDKNESHREAWPGDF